MTVMSAFFQAGNAWPFRSRFGRIEVCLRVRAANTYADLPPKATALSVGGCTVWVASLGDLDRCDAARVRTGEPTASP